MTKRPNDLGPFVAGAKALLDPNFDWTSGEWIADGDDVDVALADLERIGCDRRRLLSYLNRGRAYEALRLDESVRRDLRREVELIRKQLAQPIAALVPSERKQPIEDAVLFVESIVLKMTPKAISENRNFWLYRLLCEVKIRSGEHRDELVGDLISSAFPYFAGGEQRRANTQIHWRLDHQERNSAAAMRALKTMLVDEGRLSEN